MLIEQADLRNRLIRLDGLPAARDDHPRAGRSRAAHQPLSAHAVDHQHELRGRHRGRPPAARSALRAALGLPGRGAALHPLRGRLAGRAAAHGVFALAAFPTWHQPLLVAGVFVLLEALCSLAWSRCSTVRARGSPRSRCSARSPSGPGSGARRGCSSPPRSRCAWSSSPSTYPAWNSSASWWPRPRPSPRTSPTTSVCSPRTTDEAARIVEEYSKDHPLEAVYDDLILPALGRARRDRRTEQLPEVEERYVWSAAREIVLSLHARRHAAKLAADVEGGAGPPATARPARTRFTCSPVRCATRQTSWG